MQQRVPYKQHTTVSVCMKSEALQQNPEYVLMLEQRRDLLIVAAREMLARVSSAPTESL
jgi:hypothetical protein